MKILAIDPGLANIGVALLTTDKELVDSKVIKNVRNRFINVDPCLREMIELIIEHDEDFDIRNDIMVAIEVPAPAYFGRANSVSLISLFWQILWLHEGFLRLGFDVQLIESTEWNRSDSGGKQMSDAVKKEKFYELFPDQGRTNADVRDAALIGIWMIDHLNKTNER